MITKAELEEIAQYVTKSISGLEEQRDAERASGLDNDPEYWKGREVFFNETIGHYRLVLDAVAQNNYAKVEELLNLN